MTATPAAERIGRLFAGAVRGRLLVGEPLRAHTSFRVGGPADVLFFPASREDLRAGLRLAAAQGIPVTVMGRGTNLLVRDGGVRGVVVNLGDLSGIAGGEIPPRAAPGTPVELEALAGTPLSQVINFAVRPGLSGLEWAAGIPGSLGGAIAMNAGAHGHSMGEVVLWVDLMDQAGAEAHVPREAVKFGYRSTAFPRAGFVVAAGLRLRTSTEQAVLAENKRCLEEHKRRLPFGWGSAGSVFKNPPGDAAGRLIDAAGLKGTRVGGAEVSAKHANVIVNVGQATAADILELMRRVEEQVLAHAGVALDPEIQVIGEE
ncbi:MAG TPA: UDP-N-acetylmuramate dehydrogenase [Candidatus Methanoperedens sp.]|nr:UDP-N-acetylmuramate dehydrogenase [Candidatus Methanoperedens sp.]